MICRYWGRNNGFLEFMYNGCVRLKKSTRTCISVSLLVIYILSAGCAAATGYFTAQAECSAAASAVAFLISIVQVIAFIYNVVQYCSSDKEAFYLDVDSSATKVTSAGWYTLANPTLAQENSDRYVTTSSGSGFFPRIRVKALVYDTHIIVNDDHPQVFARSESAQKWYESHSYADFAACSCCDTDQQCCYGCSCKPKAFNVQLTILLIAGGQLGLILTSYYNNNNNNNNNNYYERYTNRERKLVCSGTEAWIAIGLASGQLLLHILLAVLTCLVSTDMKFCFVFCINCQCHYRHRGPYIEQLNQLVRQMYHKQGLHQMHFPVEVTPDDNHSDEHPRYTKKYLMYKHGNEDEARQLKDIVWTCHSFLYKRAFPDTPTPPLRISATILGLLNDYYSSPQEEWVVDDILSAGEADEDDSIVDLNNITIEPRSVAPQPHSGIV